jgi:hypothetical protein
MIIYFIEWNVRIEFLYRIFETLSLFLATSRNIGFII